MPFYPYLHDFLKLIQIKGIFSLSDTIKFTNVLPKINNIFLSLHLFDKFKFTVGEEKSHKCSQIFWKLGMKRKSTSV